MSLDTNIANVQEEKESIKRFKELVEMRKKKEALLLYNQLSDEEQETIRRDYLWMLKSAQMQF